ncbi:MAG: MCE family protein [Proteobacteria bacterium]|nr:MCE family protein [Pseudomonadota bacterium]
METRAHHVLIGGFVLLVVLGLFTFVIWLARIDLDRDVSRYIIFFEGAVSGLSTSSNVMYNGIPVGSVQEIDLDPRDPSRVRVVIEVDATTPVRTDSVATLELQGITGVSLVQISGGSASSPALVALPGQDLPVIDSRRSQIQRLFAGAPELINRAILLIEQVTRLFDEDNLEAFGLLIGDAQSLISDFAARTDDFDAILANIGETSFEMRDAAVAMNDLIISLDTQIAVLSESAEATMGTLRGTLSGMDSLVDNDIRQLVAEITKSARNVTEIIEETRGPIADFTAEGLYEFANLLTDMRQLIGNLSRLSLRLESDPAQFLFGNQQQGFETPTP